MIAILPSYNSYESYDMYTQSVGKTQVFKLCSIYEVYRADRFIIIIVEF